MLKVATVFSGIGAVEHALKRMGVEHEIVFACDNGDVDILSKEINSSYDSFYEEYELLEISISEVQPNDEYESEYKEYLNTQLNNVKNDFEILNRILNDIEIFDLANKFFLLDASDIYKILGKSKNFITEFEKHKFRFQSELNRSIKFFIIKTIIEINKKMQRGGIETYNANNFISYSSVITTELTKLFTEITNDIKDKLSMLHERISTQKILSELSNINDFSEKKKFVDEMYEKFESSNKVKLSYLANYDILMENFHWNVSFLDGNYYKNKVDLFVGGSPCQSFSLVGKQRGLDDTRGTLFYEFARLVGEVQPKVFIYENVKAVLSNNKGNTWETMQRVFRELNYNFSFKIMNAKDFGIPQNRERLFVIGFRKDISNNIEFEFPKPLKLEKKMQDYLQENVSSVYYLNRKGVEFVTSEKNLQKRYTQIDGDIQLCQKKNQQFNWHGDFVFVNDNLEREKAIENLGKYYLSEKVQKYVMSSGTKSYYIKPKTDLDIARPLLTTMHKMHRAGVDNYVTTDGKLRKLTPRECLRLMGFCDTFEIVVSDTSMYQQAGNSIVVDVLINILDKILDRIKL